LALSTSHHLETDGQTERANRTLEDMLRPFVSIHHGDWDEYLTAAEFAYNNSLQASTGHTPFFLNTSQHPLTPASLLRPQSTTTPATDDFLRTIATALEDARQHLVTAQNRQKQYADQHRQPKAYQDYHIESTRFPGRHHPPPYPVMIDDEPEWEVIESSTTVLFAADVGNNFNTRFCGKATQNTMLPGDQPPIFPIARTLSASTISNGTRTFRFDRGGLVVTGGISM
jgi:hypothetical protein